jgi:integrase
MKGRLDHLVPLSKQAVAAVREIAAVDGSPPGGLLFRSATSRTRPMSENTLGFAIRRMGFDATAHGFRHTFSTLANEAGHRADLIERQLAHEGSDKIRSRYNRADWIDERRAMLQWWADELDRLASAARKANGGRTTTAAQKIKRAQRKPRRTKRE